MININSLVRQFFVENEYDKLASKIIVIRNDGINVYSNIKDEFERSSIGALTSGLWQAAESISAYTKNNTDSFQEFRLSFDTSGNGLYVLPLTIMDNKYFICVVFAEEDNPAKLKRYVRLLRDNLETYLSELSDDQVQNREKYLFSEISDDEMDKLFAFGGV